MSHEDQIEVRIWQDVQDAVLKRSKKSIQIPTNATNVDI